MRNDIWYISFTLILCRKYSTFFVLCQVNFNLGKDVLVNVAVLGVVYKKFSFDNMY